MPIALCEPREAIYFCDNRCSEKAISYWQIASMVVEEGGEAYTVKLCLQCYNEELVQQGKIMVAVPSKVWRAVTPTSPWRHKLLF